MLHEEAARATLAADADGEHCGATGGMERRAARSVARGHLQAGQRVADLRGGSPAILAARDEVGGLVDVRRQLAAVQPDQHAERQLLQRFHRTAAEPRASLARQGLTFVKDMTSSTHPSDDDSHYYNTTGSALDYWQGAQLPRPTRDIDACRRDLRCWGYCLIDEAMSDPQCVAMREPRACVALGTHPRTARDG